MDDKNYVVIQGWMVNRLKLSGNELMVYAVIYGFSQDGESKFKGGGKYLADSAGISRRALTDILNGLLLKRYINKFEKNENGVKLCDYQTAFEFVPEENRRKGGMEDSAIPRQNFPCPRSGGKGKNGAKPSAACPAAGEKTEGGMAESANHKTPYIYKDTASSPPQPSESSADPPQEAAEALFSPGELEAAISALNRTLVLKDNFYSRAPAFMADNGLKLDYPRFVYEQCCQKKYNSFNGLYFSVFFGEDTVKLYKIMRQPIPHPPAQETACPACGSPHAERDDSCPACGLPRDALPEQITLFRQLSEFPPGKRNEYLEREQAAFEECGMNNPEIFLSRVGELQREFGIAVNL